MPHMVPISVLTNTLYELAMSNILAILFSLWEYEVLIGIHAIDFLLLRCGL